MQVELLSGEREAMESELARLRRSAEVRRACVLPACVGGSFSAVQRVVCVRADVHVAALL
jgi:hypothetical protein